MFTSASATAPSSHAIAMQPLLPESPEDIDIVPRILCNKRGPSRCKHYAFLTLFFLETPHFIYFSQLKQGPRKFLVISALTLVSYLSYLIHNCVTLPVPPKPCSKGHWSNCATTPCQTVLPGFLNMLLVIECVVIVGTFIFFVFEKMRPKRADYKKYLLTKIQPLLDQNKLASAYQKIFVPVSFLGTTSHGIRSSLCTLFVEKLLNTGCMDMNLLDRLIVAGTHNKTAADACYEKCARKLYEHNQNSSLILSIISGIYNKTIQKNLLEEYTGMQLRNRQAVYTLVSQSMEMPTQELASLVLTIVDYAGTHIGMALGFMKIFYTPALPCNEEIQREIALEQQGASNDFLVSSALSVVNAKAPTRKKEIETIQTTYQSTPCYPDPTVLLAIQAYETTLY